MHPDINLLSWREAQREKHKSRFYLMLFTALTTSMVTTLGCVHLLDHKTIQHQSLVSDLEAKRLMIAKKKESIDLNKNAAIEVSKEINAMNNIRELRSDFVNVMNWLSFLVPENVYLESFAIDNSEIELSGYSRDTESLTKMLEDFELSPAFNSINIRTIQNHQGTQKENRNSFHLTFRFNSKAKVEPSSTFTPRENTQN